MKGVTVKEKLLAARIKQVDIAQKMQISKQQIGNVLNSESHLSSEMIERIAAAIGEDITFFYDDASSQVQPLSATSVPYYDVTFECGFDELEPPFSEHPDGTISMPGYERATLWCNAEGHSMAPEISNGDLIALRRLSSEADILYGEIYGLVTTSGMRTIKRVRRSDDSTCLRLVPTNPDYDEQDIPKASVIAVYRVLGAMKKF